MTPRAGISDDNALSGITVRMAPMVAHPYLSRLVEALESNEAVREVTPLSEWNVRQLRRLNRSHDVIHLQWIEYLYSRKSTQNRVAALRSAAAVAKLVCGLGYLRFRRFRIVWTVHNRRPHDSKTPRIDHVAAAAVGRLATNVVVHSNFAAKALPDSLRHKAVVSQHGHFIGEYPPSARTRSDARQALGIPLDARVAIAFGQVRGYKRLDRLVHEFSKIADENVRLIIAGKPTDESLGNEIARLASEDSRVISLLRFVDDDEVAELHDISDIAVFAYDEVFTSGALILALSLGLPVIAPEAGSAMEIAKPPAVLSYRPGQLGQALEGALRPGQHTQQGREAALRAAKRLDWLGIANQTVTAAYRS